MKNILFCYIRIRKKKSFLIILLFYRLLLNRDLSVSYIRKMIIMKLQRLVILLCCNFIIVCVFKMEIHGVNVVGYI